MNEAKEAFIKNMREVINKLEEDGCTLIYADFDGICQGTSFQKVYAATRRYDKIEIESCDRMNRNCRTL